MTRTADDFKTDLKQMDPQQRALFCAAGAEQLFPVYARLGRPDDVTQARELLDAVWESLEKPVTRTNVVKRQDIMRLLQAFDGAYSPHNGFAVHALSAIGFAGDRRSPDAVYWVARQNEDAGSHAVAIRLTKPSSSRNLFDNSPQIAAAMEGLEAILNTVRQDGDQRDALRQEACATGERLADLFLLDDRRRD